MALLEFKMPDIGEGVAEGEIVAWHVKPGDRVVEDDPMVEVTTDKASVSIGVPKDGKVAELHAKVGEVVSVGKVIAVLEVSDQDASIPPSMRPVSSSKNPAATAVGDIRETLPGVNLFAAGAEGRSGSGRPSSSHPSGHQAGRNGSHNGGNGGSTSLSQPPRIQHTSRTPSAHFVDKPLATPATRKIARDLGVDLRRVPPSGPGGRVLVKDVESYARVVRNLPRKNPSVQITTHAAPMERQVPPPTRTPFVGVRRRIAERMQMSKNTAAHFTFVEECHVDKLSELRDKLGKDMAPQSTLNYLPFIVKAVTTALKKHPTINSSLDEQSNELVLWNEYHIGLAVATERGLLVPVLKHADQLTIPELAREIERLARGSREGSLSTAELTGSTFTVTSLGKQGGFLATPVLNFPEVGILGIHRIQERPVVRDGKIEIGQVMMMSFSFDHRIIDGHIGAAFAYEVIGYLQEPERLLLEMS